MIEIRKSEERGHANHCWLDSHHTFSFGNYRDPTHMGFRVLRVINEDRVTAGNGFGTHAHDNMEIISYIVSGELEHKDSMGNGSVIKAGELQIITAGTGITHSEFNPSKDGETHFYQMWVTPDTRNLEPAYGQKELRMKHDNEHLELVACKAPTNGALQINQDVRVYLGRFSTGESVTLPLKMERHGWLQVVKGSLELEGVEIHTSDGAAISDTQNPQIVAGSEVEVLFFDLP